MLRDSIVVGSNLAAKKFDKYNLKIHFSKIYSRLMGPETSGPNFHLMYSTYRSTSGWLWIIYRLGQSSASGAEKAVIFLEYTSILRCKLSFFMYVWDDALILLLNFPRFSLINFYSEYPFRNWCCIKTMFQCSNKLSPGVKN